VEKSGARINFAKPGPNDHLDPNANRACTLSGSPQQIQAAQSLINDEVAQIQQRSH
jgi:hypothetical protein